MDTKRKTNIEGLRALGIVLVIISHFMVMFYPASYWNNIVCHTSDGIEVIIGSTPLGFFMNGNTGVMIFLVITGAGAYWLTKAGKKKIVKSIINRPFKILVPMLLSMVIIWAIIQLNGCFLDQALNKTGSIWCAGYIDNVGSFIGIFSDLFNFCTLYNAPLWTMKYLFIGFYLGVFVCWIASDYNRKQNLAIGTIIVLFILKEYYLIAVLLGVIVSEMADTKEKNINVSCSFIIMLVAIYLGGVPSGMVSKYWIYRYLPIDSVLFNSSGFYVLIYHMISAALWLWLSFNSKIIKWLLNTRAFQLIGRYSMGLYFTHFIVLISFTSLVFLKLNIESYNYNVMVSIPLSLFVMLLLAVIFNYVNNKIIRCIEKKLWTA